MAQGWRPFGIHCVQNFSNYRKQEKTQLKNTKLHSKHQIHEYTLLDFMDFVLIYRQSRAIPHCDFEQQKV